MAFIKIYEREPKTLGNGMRQITLTQVVGCNLTNEQYDELEDYFIEETPCENIVKQSSSTITFEFVNHWEKLEGAPLPDGCIVNADSFKEISYLIVMGKGNIEVPSDRFIVSIKL
jgi:hypothetical protein